MRGIVGVVKPYHVVSQWNIVYFVPILPDIGNLDDRTIKHTQHTIYSSSNGTLNTIMVLWRIQETCKHSPHTRLSRKVYTQCPHTRPAHKARTQGPHTRPAHKARTQGPHTRSAHKARTQGPHTRPAHKARTQGPHTRPAHKARTQGPHTRPAHKVSVNVTAQRLTPTDYKQNTNEATYWRR